MLFAGKTLRVPSFQGCIYRIFHSNNHFGFNAWQLERFTKINSEKYPEFSNIEYGELEKSFQNLLIELEGKGEVELNQAKNRYYSKRPNIDPF